MDANTLVTFLVGGIVIIFFLKDQAAKLFRAADERPAVEPLTAETIAAATPEQPLPVRAWLDYVNRQPDRVPHVAIIGPSGAGKTTTATAILADRPGGIVVLTAKEGDDWGGLPYVGIDDDATYTTAVDTFDALSTEVKQRLLAVKQQRMTADWLTIVVDDFSTLVKEAPSAADVVKLVARLGRSLRVRLVMLSDSALVKAIGLEGEGETRSNFAFIRLRRGHAGTLEVEGGDVPIDTAMLDRFARSARLAARSWRIPRSPGEELSAYLGLSASAGAFLGQTDQTDQTRRLQTGPSERVLMRRYHDAGLSREQARRLLQSEGLGLDNNEWAKLGGDNTLSA